MVNTTSFMDLVKTAVKAEVVTQMSNPAVGTSNTTPTVGDVALGAETIRKARQDYTEGTSDVTISLWISSVEGNGTSLKETGVFNASSGGTLLTHETFTAISKTSGIELWIDVEEQIDVSQ